MHRIPEPDLMDDPAQALAYAQADFSEPHDHFVALFRECFPQAELRGTVLDLGCGPADITVRFARAFPDCRVHGVDGAESMLALGREAVAAAGLSQRITLVQGLLPGASLPLAAYDAAISNSLLHHLADPMALWQALQAHVDPAGPVMVMDLLRPDSPAHLDTLVATYAADAPEILRHDFRASLCAAYRVPEVREQLRSAGLAHMRVRVVSDRHFIVSGRIRDDERG